MRGKPLLLALLLPLAAGAYNINYNVNLVQYKETSTLTNNFSFSQEISQRVNLNVDAGFTADRSDDLDRFIDARSGTARVSWRPDEDMEFASTLHRTISLEDRFGEMVQDKVEDTATGEIRYWPADWLSMDLGLGIHIYDSRYASGDTTATLYDKGAVRRASISMNRRVLGLVGTSLALAENRTYGDQTNSGNDDLTGRLSYSFPRLFDGGNLTVQVSARKDFVSYADSLQTHREDTWMHSETFTAPELLPRISFEMGTAWSWTNRVWEDSETGELLGDVRDRKDRLRDIHSSIRWDIMDDLELDVSVSRDLDRSDRLRQGVGVDTLSSIWDVTDRRKLTASLKYTPGDNRITFTRVLELVRFDTFGVWFDSYGNEYEDNSDRDELREVLGLAVSIPIDARLTLTGDLQGQQRETYYLMAEQSANSKKSSVYSFMPGFEYDLGNRWEINGSVKFSADYTTYIFPEAATSGNLLFRNVSSFFTFQNLATDSTQLGFSHRLRFQDQGSYDDHVFSRSEESLNSTLSFFGGFHISRDLGVTPSYSWEYSRREYPGGSQDPRVEHLHHVGLRTRMIMSSGVLSIDITRTFYSREGRPSYWRAAVAFNYLL